jgi:hypothetical protein
LSAREIKRKADAEAYQREQTKIMEADQERADRRIAEMRRRAGGSEETQKKPTHAGRIITLSADTSKADAVENAAKAQTFSVDIYAYLEQGKVDIAYRKFQLIRDPLKQYLDAEAFAILEKTVTDTWRGKRDAEQRQRDSVSQAQLVKEEAKAKTPEEQLALDIYSLISSDRVKDAYAMFNANKRKLERGLTKEKFDQLKTRVEKQYRILRNE